MNQLPQIKSLVDLMAYFKNEDECKKYLKKLIWKDVVPSECPRCGNAKTYQFKDGHTYKCSGCRKKFNLLTNTIFENTKIPLQKWIIAIYLACTEKRGTSSYQLSQFMGLTQKTAWFMLQRIRTMFEELQPQALEGICTADETYVGGKQKNKHMDKRVKGQQGRGSSEKINVFGVMEVDGMVKSEVVQNVKRETLIPLIQKYVTSGSTIMTDEWHGYNGLNKSYDHHVCDHGRYQYVSDTGATTNPIENYWSHLKRAVIGTYYHVSKKHIQRYLFEFDYKFNYRNMKDGDRLNMTIAHVRNTRLKYKDLIK